MSHFKVDLTDKDLSSGSEKSVAIHFAGLFSQNKDVIPTVMAQGRSDTRLEHRMLLKASKKKILGVQTNCHIISWSLH